MQATNPVSSNLEKVTLTYDGQDFEVVWSEKVSGVWQDVTLTDNAVSDTCPRLAFFPDGSTGVSWIEDGSTVVYRGRDAAGVWQATTARASSGSGTIGFAWLSVHGNSARVVWAETCSAGQCIVAGGGDPGPWPQSLVTSMIASTAYSGSIGAEVHSDSGHLWAVWVHDGDELGYSEHGASGWGSVLYESYSGPTDIPAAKERVADDVTQ
jgi:hypothetical protein